jgi:hypothetical protein
MGGDADIDNFLIATRSNLQDLGAAVVQLKAKAVRQLFEQTFVTGDVGVNAKAFDGLDKLTDPAQSISMGANGATLTLAGSASPSSSPPWRTTADATPSARGASTRRPRRRWTRQRSPDRRGRPDASGRP